jgi:SAM-dependent methyltransferase
VTALEVDARQHAENLAMPQPGLHFVAAPAQAVPCAAASFDLALMLKSLHHVPVAEMGLALDEARRVLRPGGLLYISEPVYGGDFSDIVRLYHDERVERAAAQAALDAAVRSGRWTQLAQRWFATSSHFVDFADFARRVVGVTYADYRLDDDTLALVRAAFERHLGPDGAHFLRPMHVRLLRCATRPS